MFQRLTISLWRHCGETDFAFCRMGDFIDGWKVHVEVVEVRRIPDTTDVLALYEVQVDEDGDLMGYRRLRRYARGVPGEN